MQFYYLVMCMLLDLKSDEMRKIKVLKFEKKKIKNKRGKTIDMRKELKYQKCSIRLLNTIINRINKMVKKVDLVDDFKTNEEIQEGFEET